MAIRRLKVSNFRSFSEFDIELGDFNVLIGANASGKSNFVEVFRFLRDIRKEGLRNAVALQGGSPLCPKPSHRYDRIAKH